MDTSAVVSLALSVIAVVTSVFFAVKQIAVQRTLNNAPAVIELLTAFRAPEVHRNFEFVCNGGLGAYDSDGGLQALPAADRDRVYDVCYLLQQIGLMIILGTVNEVEFTALFRARTLAVWDVVEPYIYTERKINPATGREFMTALEIFARKARSQPVEVGQEVLRKWLGKSNLPFRWRLIPRRRGLAERRSDGMPAAVRGPDGAV